MQQNNFVSSFMFHVSRILLRNWLPLMLAAGYTVIFSTLSIARHEAFRTQTWDLGIFEQSFWNTLHGRVMFNNFEGANHLSIHFSPFLFLLVPFYALWPGPDPLLVLQAIALGSAVIPLHRLVATSAGRRTALVASLMYLLLPSLHWLNLFDFHEVALAVPALLWAFDFMSANRTIPAAVALALAASVAENIIIAVSGVGLYLLVNKRSRRFGTAVLASSAAYFLVVSTVLMPALGGKIYRFDRYASVGDSPVNIIRTIVTRPNVIWRTITHPEKLAYLGRLLATTAGLPLLAPTTLILLLPGLAQNLLTDYTPQFASSYQYDAILIPFLMIGVAGGWLFLARRFPKAVPALRWGVLGTSLAAFIWWSPLGLGAYPWTQFQLDERAKTLAQIRNAIAPQAKVAAATNLVPHLTHRDGIWMVGAEPAGLPDLVVIDLWDTTGFDSSEQFGNYLSRYVDDAGYRSQLIRQRFMILTRR